MEEVILGSIAMVLVTERLIPIKFLSLLCNLFLFLVVTYTKDNNIYAGIDGLTGYDDAKKSIIACVVLGIILLVLELLLLLSGITLFFNQSTAIRTLHPEIFLHVFGVVFLSWFILEHWAYGLIWPIWIFVSYPLPRLIPFLMDVFSIVTMRVMLKQKG